MVFIRCNHFGFHSLVRSLGAEHLSQANIFPQGVSRVTEASFERGEPLSRQAREALGWRDSPYAQQAESLRYSRLEVCATAGPEPQPDSSQTSVPFSHPSRRGCYGSVVMATRNGWPGVGLSEVKSKNLMGTFG